MACYTDHRVDLVSSNNIMVNACLQSFLLTHIQVSMYHGVSEMRTNIEIFTNRCINIMAFSLTELRENVFYAIQIVPTS